MAEVMQNFPRQRNGKESFWDQFADGQIWKIPESELPTKYSSNAIQSARMYAKQRGMKVSTSQVVRDHLVVQFFQADDPRAPNRKRKGQAT